MSERESSPGGFIVSGVALGVVGGVLGAMVGFNQPAGLVIAITFGSLGQICLGIGVIAKGVQVGNRQP